MTSQPSPSLYSGSPSGSAPTNGSPQRMALDNIIRRELRVSDPSDPNQIAQALLTRYKDTPRAQAISQEAKGLPFLQAAPMQALVPQATTSSDSELQQAKDDVERDLHELTTNSLLKDVTPELQGWAQAVRSAITEGTTAARFALDPRQRDKAFGIRRQLGEYARMARLVGALTPTLSLPYRKFAQSLDENAALILVIMGEALANVGFNGGRFLLQVPYSDLQARRDAVIHALRNLLGTTQEAYGDDYARGLHAYRLLFKRLEELGQGDLRILLVENELSRIMDELIQRAAHGRADGLRALGATAHVDLSIFNRLIVVGQSVLRGGSVALEGTPGVGITDTDSPQLQAFLDTLLLFIEAFNTAGGFRLLRIARPPILLYGLYGTTGLQKAENRLLNLVIQRNLLADQLDCLLQCDCGTDIVKCQIVLDKILFDIDRAIDLYALGSKDLGEPECRASAYSHVIGSIVDVDGNGNGALVAPCPAATLPSISSMIASSLKEIGDRLHPNFSDEAGAHWEGNVDFDVRCPKRLRVDELRMQFYLEERWENLVRTMAPNCLGDYSVFFEEIKDLIKAALCNIDDSSIECVDDEGVRTMTDAELIKTCPPIDVITAPTPAHSQDRIADFFELLTDKLSDATSRRQERARDPHPKRKTVS